LLGRDVQFAGYSQDLLHTPIIYQCVKRITKKIIIGDSSSIPFPVKLRRQLCGGSFPRKRAFLTSAGIESSSPCYPGLPRFAEGRDSRNSFEEKVCASKLG
jgi:hypothetical protein